MKIILILTSILIFAELFEAIIQRSRNALGMLEKLNIFYSKSIFLFFLVQPSFYIILFIILFTNVLNISMIFLLSIKIMDIFYKMYLIKQVFIEKEVSQEVYDMLHWEMPSWFFLVGVFTYPPMLFFALL